MVAGVVKAAVLGTGIAGRERARELRAAGVTIVAGVDPDYAAASSFCAESGGTACRDVATMLHSQTPDVAVIASPNHAHAANLTAVTEAGIRNIFCEKPLASCVEQAQQMAELAERYALRTSMGFSGLQPAYRRILEIVESGRLGSLLTVALHTFRGYGFWGQERINQSGVRGHHTAVAAPEVSGGWAIHHACHQVFLLSKLAGPIKAVYGQLGASRQDVPSEEVVTATLVFENQAVGTLLDSIGSFRGLRVTVVGARGTLLMSDDHLKRDGSSAEIRIRYEGEDEDHRELLAHDAGQNRLAEFIEAIRRDEPSPITFREGLENLVICRAIQQSSQTGAAIAIETATRETADQVVV